MNTATDAVQLIMHPHEVVTMFKYEKIVTFSDLYVFSTVFRKLHNYVVPL